MIIFFNGAYREDDTTRISIKDRGFTLGDGVFDTMLLHNKLLQHPEDHFDRLVKNAAVLDIKPPYSAKEFVKIAENIVKKNSLLRGRYAMRTTITRGVGVRGLSASPTAHPTVLMSATEVPAPASMAEPEIEICVNIRRNEHSPLSYIKSLNYGDNILALTEVQQKGFNEAVMLNIAGNVACATTSNIYIREGKKFFTPPLTDGALDGITRKNLMRGKTIIEEQITPERLRAADNVYLSNSIIGTRTVKRLGDKMYAKKVPLLPTK